jgi:hypothetical protein
MTAPKSTRRNRLRSYRDSVAAARLISEATASGCDTKTE